MKTQIAIVAGVLAIMSMSAVGCRQRADYRPEHKAFVTDSITYADSITATSGTATAQVGIMFPTDGYEPLTNNIRRWISSTINSAPGSSFSVVHEKTYNDPMKVAKEVVERFLSESKTDLNDPTLADTGADLEYEMESHVYPIMNTDSIVTYYATTYQYLSGAHGSTGFAAQTFSAGDGNAMGFDMIQPDSLRAFYGLVTQGLAKNLEVKPDELAEVLLVPVDSIVPQNPPFLAPEGMIVQYQQYEIAPYSMGMPRATIPYDQIKPLLQPAVVAKLGLK